MRGGVAWGEEPERGNSVPAEGALQSKLTPTQASTNYAKAETAAPAPEACRQRTVSVAPRWRQGLPYAADRRNRSSIHPRE